MSREGDDHPLFLEAHLWADEQRAAGDEAGRHAAEVLVAFAVDVLRPLLREAEARNRTVADETVRLPCDDAILIERVIRELCFHWEGGDLPAERDCKEAHAALARAR